MKAKNCDPCLKRDSIFSIETFSRQKQDLTDPRSTYQDRSRQIKTVSRPQFDQGNKLRYCLRIFTGR